MTAENGTDNLVSRLEGRARFCDDRGEVKTPELLRAAQERITELEAVLSWYAEQVSDCRKISQPGDIARQVLDRDGGAKARAVLTKSN